MEKKKKMLLTKKRDKLYIHQALGAIRQQAHGTKCSFTKELEKGN